MPKSKLEYYEAIISTLGKKALPADSIAFECSMNCVVLQKRLEFLIKNGIVEREINRDHNNVVFKLTRRGTAISKTLIITSQLQKLQISHDSSDFALQGIQKTSSRNQE